ncbi:hypothetical protein SCAR479_09419 [Seiridium cardinale]|uniref:Uncharacterized protein n=1 Tax=Seiridium cardinale TaxID=138064 RepID=A0ABR2XIZ3_9PEZI
MAFQNHESESIEFRPRQRPACQKYMDPEAYAGLKVFLDPRDGFVQDLQQLRYKTSIGQSQVRGPTCLLKKSWPSLETDLGLENGGFFLI